MEIIQLLLMLASLTAVADATRGDSGHAGPATRYSSAPADHEREPDRRFSDLARLDRQRREAARPRSQGRLQTAAFRERSQ